MLSWIAFGVALLLTAGIAAVLHAPATWLDQWLREASRNGVRLADAGEVSGKVRRGWCCAWPSERVRMLQRARLSPRIPRTIGRTTG